MIPLAIVSLFLVLWLNSGNKEKERALSEASHDSTERYGVLQRASTSGDMRFDYYDRENGKVLENWNGHPWFFATVADLKDDKNIDDYFDYVQKNKESVFKITGIKEKDDCDYYGDGSCLEDITVEKIETYKKY